MWNREGNAFILDTHETLNNEEHWLIKVTTKKNPNRGRREYDLNMLAKDVGVVTADCELIVSSDGLEHFAVRRFDCEKGRRHHLLSYAAMAHVAVNGPAEKRTYEGVFEAIQQLKIGKKSLEQMFKRMCFNVIIDENDDHTRNISFLLKQDGGWGLAPAYDITGSAFSDSDSWSGSPRVHQMSINGRFENISVDDVVMVANRFGIQDGLAIYEDMKRRVENDERYREHVVHG